MRNYFVKKSFCKTFSVNFDYVAYKYDSKIVRVLNKKKNYEMDLMVKEEKSLKYFSLYKSIGIEPFSNTVT